ncbi:MAG: Co2+/Mg2+ efflux protein ApaG [Deltaproteobacteria bacterium]|nr:Co2+/Mg2+ efflux protein ApaG [Deltaproteobacteria bacterium]
MATTRGVRVQVEAEYLPGESVPENNYYFFSYHVTITNQGEETVQLLNRHWIITNADGKKEEVRGAGVIGQQPLLHPGESFHYSSFCPLATPVGTMQGSYEMAAEGGGRFDAAIAPFTLAMPGMLQ